jgi:hypothetical protein
MFDKVLIAAWILLGSILIVENFVNSAWAYLFFEYWNTGFVVLFSILIWIAIWYGFRWKMLNKEEYENDDYDY